MKDLLQPSVLSHKVRRDLPPSAPKHVILAHVSGAHGIRGDVTVRTHTGAPEDLNSYGPLLDAKSGRQFEIVQLRVTAKGVVVRFKGIADRNAAEALRGTELCVERSQLPPAEDGEFYHVDLIGLVAVDPDGQAIGRVVAIQNFGAGEMLEIKSDKPETEYVPFTDTFVPTVDIAQGRVIVIMPEMVGEPEGAAPIDEADAGIHDERS